MIGLTWRQITRNTIVIPGRLLTDDPELNERSRSWTDGILGQYAAAPVDSEREPAAAQLVEVGNFKTH